MSLPLIVFSWAVVVLTGWVAGRLAKVSLKAGSLPEGLLALFFGSGAAAYALLLLPGSISFAVEGQQLIRQLAATLLAVPPVAVVLFTWLVFRRQDGWARSLAWLLGTAAFSTVVFAEWLAAPLGVAAQVSLAEPTAFFWLAMAVKAACYGWTCLEACAFYGKACKREAAGLMDAVVANRFLLWAVWSGAASAMVALKIVNVVFFLQVVDGQRVTPAPLVLLTIAGGLACVGAVCLTFAPPAFYRRWLLARAGSSQL